MASLPSRPRAAEPLTSSWLGDFAAQLYRGHHVLLHGNINDLVLAAGRDIGFAQALVRLLDEFGYDVVARYDVVDGLQAAPGSDAARFDALLTSMAGQQSDPAAVAQDSSPTRTGAARQDVVQAARAPHAASMANPEVAAQRIHQILSQSDVATAVWADAADLLIRDPRHIDLSERQLLMRIRRAMRDAAIVPGKQGRNLRNVIVFSTTRLAHIPEGFVTDDPTLTTVEVPLPDFKERLTFLSQRFSRFYGSEGIADDEQANVVDRLARLSDSIGFRNLDAMARLSTLASIDVDDSSRLVSYFRFGVRHDPWSDLRSSDVRRSRETLIGRVIGQPQAVEALVEAVMAAHLGIDFVADPNASAGRPKGAFFFVGPTGVGKTELAKALAELLFGDAAALIRFDMSEYSQSHSVERLVGSPPGYVGYGEGGQLTRRVLERPFSVLLFDEIEKADRNVFDKFLQILDEGRLTDGQGRTADFSQTVIIFTSNQGTAELYGQGDPTALDYEKISDHYRAHITNYFRQELGRPELLGRLGEENVLAFDVLRSDSVRAIASKFLDQLLRSLESSGLDVRLDREAALAAVRQDVQRTDVLLEGGRGIRRAVDRTVRKPLLRWLVENEEGGVPLWIGFDAGTGGITVTPEVPGPDENALKKAWSSRLVRPRS